MVEAQKKGLSPLAWVAIGCGVLVVFVMVVAAVGGIFVFNKAKDVVADFEENPVRSSAEMVVRLNPELELVESDDEAGTMTIRNKETGEVATFDYEAISEGKFSWETSEGKFEIDASDAEQGRVTMTTEDGEARFGAGAAAEIPDWVPVMSGSEPQATFSMESGGESTGTFTFESDRSPQQVLDFYAERLEGEGYEVARNTTESGGRVTQGTVGAEKDGRLTVSVIATRSDEGTSVVVQYSSKE